MSNRENDSAQDGRRVTRNEETSFGFITTIDGVEWEIKAYMVHHSGNPNAYAISVRNTEQDKYVTNRWRLTGDDVKAEKQWLGLKWRYKRPEEIIDDNIEMIRDYCRNYYLRQEAKERESEKVADKLAAKLEEDTTDAQ